MGLSGGETTYNSLGVIRVSCYLVSACLLGINCRYDGKDNRQPAIITALSRGFTLIPVCPEQLGGLPTPRAPAELSGGDGHRVLVGRATVINREGMDVTSYFIRGAELTGQLARLYQVNGAILKENSPSCGSNQVYDGGFQNRLIKGCGVTTALLKNHGLRVISERGDLDLFLLGGASPPG